MRTATCAPDQKPDSRGNVYFLVMDGPTEPEHGRAPVKVGITSGDVVDRIATLQTGNPFTLVCFDSFETRWPRDVERHMHLTHTLDMHQNEWMWWSRDGLDRLVVEAKDAAQQIADRRSKEEYFSAQESNGYTRAASREELQLRADADGRLGKLVEAQLNVEIAENRLKAATGTTRGIPGVVRVDHVLATNRFSKKLAASEFSDRYIQCCHETICGDFEWHDPPQPSFFDKEHKLKLATKKAARAAALSALRTATSLEGLTDRTPEIECWHNEFLKETDTVHSLRAELADLKTVLTLLLGEDEAIDQVCRYRRRSEPRFNSVEFREGFAEGERCAVPVAGHLKKHVYTFRSYM